MNNIMQSYAFELADSKVSSLVHYLDGELKAGRTSLELLASNPIIRDGSKTEAMDYLKARQSMLEGFDFILIGDTTGYYVTTLDYYGNISDRAYFHQVMNGETVISDPVVSKTTGQPQIVIATPIKNASGQITGILAGTVSLARLSAIVNSEKFGDSGYAFMLDSSGKVIAHPLPEYLMTDRLKNSENPAVMSTVSSMSSGQTGKTTYEENGETYVTAYAPLNTVPWSLGVTAPLDELYLGINLSWAVVIGIAIMGFLFLLLILYRSLQEGEHEFRELLDSINAGVIVYSPDLAVIYANPPVLEIVAAHSTHQNQQFPHQVHWLDSEGQPISEDQFPACRARSELIAVHGFVMGIRNPKDDSVVWFLCDCFPIFQADGALRQLVMTLVNMTERKHLEEELYYYSTTDMLTGAGNRRSGLTILQKMVELFKRQGLNLVVCFFDLNDLKPVNDIYGHAQGDNYIRMVADIVAESIRAADTLVRMGGDEFLIILPQCDLDHAAEVMKRVENRLAAVNQAGQYPFKASISYGLAACQEGSSCSCEELINHADAEMYLRKEAFRQAKKPLI